MNLMITVSLMLNIVILIPVTLGLITEATWADQAYGERSPARDILLSVYLAILLVSFALLIWKISTAVAALLLVQVVYKVITPITVGSVDHPVVATNLFVVACHTVTLGLIWLSIGRSAVT
ncbi:MAG: hypothetical protein AAFV74_21060 [Pseudomonadota bacterium]